MTWRNSLSHDWISENKAKSFPVMEYYTDLRWTRTVKRALHNTQERLSNIFDILSLSRAVEEPTNILVEGKKLDELHLSNHKETISVKKGPYFLLYGRNGLEV